MMSFLLRRYSVTVNGFAPHDYDAHSPASARVRAWNSYCSYQYVSFREFLKISSVKRSADPEGYGKKITVSGAPAYLVSRNDHRVLYVRPSDKRIFASHPLDVQEVEW
jgi:hypothetical protein